MIRKTCIYTLAGLAAAITLMAFSFRMAEKGYTIKGTVPGMKTGMAYLIHTYNNETIKDSAVVKRGRFMFTGVAPEPLIYTLRLSGDKSQATIFVENSNITILARKDTLYKSVVTGSTVHDEFKAFYDKAWKPVTTKAGEIYRRLDSANQKGKVELSPDVRKAFDDEFAALNKMNDSVIIAFVAGHANSVASASVIQDRFISYSNFEQAKKAYAILSEPVKQSFYGKQIKASLEVAALTEEGKVVPDFAMNDTTGRAVRLSDFKGKYVLLDFWASWCGPCRKENPNVVKAYEKYHSKGFDIVSVSLDNKKEAWIKAIHDDGLTWTHLSDLKGWKNEAAVAYGVKAVPSSFLLDKSGKVIARNLRGEELEEKLAEIFGKQ